MKGRPKGSKDKSENSHKNRSLSHIGNKGQNWKGGKVKKPDGYVLIWCPTHPNNKNGYVLEHRLIMEKHIGRTLLPSEIVHHMNCIVSDNRIENLMLFESNGTHRNFHRHHLGKGTFGKNNPNWKKGITKDLKKYYKKRYLKKKEDLK
jgi:hypothetical protein